MMATSERSAGLLARGLGLLWRLLTGFRQLLANLLLVLVLGVVVGVLLIELEDPVVDGSALLLRPGGQIVEQVAVSDPLGLLQRGVSPEQTPLRELLEAVRAAKDDGRIKALVIETDDLTAGGLAKLQELRSAIEDFRSAGKPVYAWGSRFTQGQYFFASLADEVFMAPDGFVLVHGLASFPTYFKGALDRLGVRMQIFRVGSYKSAVEPYTRADMSPEDRDATRTLLDGLWQEWTATVAERRGLSIAELDAFAAGYAERLAAAGGDGARLALEAKLVDGLKTPDQWEDFLKEQFGADAEGKRPRFTRLSAYVSTLDERRPEVDARIAVVAVQGTITDGDQPPGVAGGETVARLLREAREDETIKAVVLRVDSPGGSVYASERIRREVERVREAGKPVIASMSSLAASGGYWIAMGADEVWASPATLTGSIGIFGMFPDFSEPLARLGVTVDGVATSPMAGGLDPRRPLAPGVAAALQSSVDHGYRRFIRLVAEAREMSPERVDELAQGRVWTGAQALERGLVDRLGGLDEAVAAAALRANVSDYRVSWREPHLSPQDRLLERLLRAVGVRAPGAATGGTLGSALAALVGELRQFDHWNDPQHAYAHCLCAAP